ncbi:hypothetical protein AYI70_g998 [Smittium culicis]|uniref:Uncharacterized protein n=1 Tax=Smittium culicis TaxID=133412 RepID=A0A1R1YEF4_9FUNG|nr:hypothetical protein AYI70_g998 [Smittium culicis]
MAEEEKPKNQQNYISISPTRRFFSHALAGISEADEVLVKYDPETLDEVMEPTNKLIQNITTLSLFSISAFSFYKRRRIMKEFEGRLSIAGAGPTLLSWNGTSKIHSSTFHITYYFPVLLYPSIIYNA